LSLIDTSFPHSCSKTGQLYLDGNKLNGSLPTEFGNLASLGKCRHTFSFLVLSLLLIPAIVVAELLYLDDNLLNGTVPSELGNLNRIGACIRYLFYCSLHSSLLSNTCHLQLNYLSVTTSSVGLYVQTLACLEILVSMLGSSQT
jgi:hypothetical protein